MKNPPVRRRLSTPPIPPRQQTGSGDQEEGLLHQVQVVSTEGDTQGDEEREQQDASQRVESVGRFHVQTPTSSRSS